MHNTCIRISTRNQDGAVPFFSFHLGVKYNEPILHGSAQRRTGEPWWLFEQSWPTSHSRAMPKLLKFFGQKRSDAPWTSTRSSENQVRKCPETSIHPSVWAREKGRLLADSADGLTASTSQKVLNTTWKRALRSALRSALRCLLCGLQRSLSTWPGCVCLYPWGLHDRLERPQESLQLTWCGVPDKTLLHADDCALVSYGACYILQGHDDALYL